jgi:phosphoribosylaminoimidazole-succinocarboxamide synthase
VRAALEHVHSGKVRDLYRTSDGSLLMVASDRISAFDHVLATPIPDKGRILTALSAWWFERLGDLAPNHLRAVDGPAIPAEWRGRAMLCEPLDMVAVECVARGYLTGSGLAQYRESGAVCGVPLPDGLVDGSRLPEPIFTPTTKAEVGAHDEAMTFDAVVDAVGGAVAEELRRITLLIYAAASAIADRAGVLLADTKVEFGFDGTGRLVLGDELLTPDSSRFWPADEWEPGHAQPSFDKQYVRDWLVSPEARWDRAAGDAPPPLPGNVVAATRQRYVQAYERLTRALFADWIG